MNIEKKIKIGITISFAIPFLANGLQQNIIFLKNLLSNITNFDPVYIYTGEKPEVNFLSNESCVSYSEFVNQKYIEYDLVIMMGYWFDQQTLTKIRNSNKKIKIILMQCGNQLVENSMRSVHQYEKVSYFNNYLNGIDSIWILPQHSQNITYMKTFYRVDDINIVPYIWDKLFIDIQLKEMNIGEIETNSLIEKIKDIVILEPNFSIIKNCLIPLFIVENFERKNSNLLTSCNIIAGNKIMENHYFVRLILQLDIFQKRKDFLKAYGRHKFVHAIKKFGSIVISHQLENDLNYLYFDALYLNLPLIHNSYTLRNYGYYYPHNDIELASEQIEKIIKNHHTNISSYRKETKALINSFGINNRKNKEKYLQLINQALKK